MGYTHYFRSASEIDKGHFNAFVEDVKKIYAYPGVRDIICADSDDSDSEPIADEREVFFNGKGEEGHETFHLPRLNPKPDYQKRFDNDPLTFNFCKTAHKPYDAVVTAVLLAAHKRLGDQVKISSDGEWEEWIEGRRLYKEVFGEEPARPFSDEE